MTFKICKTCSNEILNGNYKYCSDECKSSDIEKKKCSKCGIIKSLLHFYKRPESKDGYRNDCIDCHQKRYRIWAKNNKDKCSNYSREWRQQNKERSNAISKKYRDNNKDKRYIVCTEWRKNNPDKSSKIQKRNFKKRYKDPMKKLNYLIRGGIIQSIIKKSKASRHWEDLVGYNINQLRSHLEKQFMKGMTWDNHGKWHIDHKIPVSAFNFSRPEHADFKKCWALKNLQPMWANENISKGNKLSKSFQPSLLIAKSRESAGR